jgi:hypothetical protein
MMIELQKIVVETPFKTRTATVITVSEVTSRCEITDDDYNVSGHKQPLAVAVAAGKGVRAFNIDGEEMEIQDFFEKYPDARPLLEKRPSRRRKQQ